MAGSLPSNIQERPLRQWKNEHRNYRDAAIDGVYDVFVANAGTRFDRYVATNGTVQKLLSVAQRDGTRLRAVGGNWSFSKIAWTDGHLINTKNMVVGFPMARGDVSASYAGNRKDLFLFHGGTTIADISAALGSMGYSLKTSGASNGQTIAGALSTGTHGAALDFGAIPEFVVGLHLAVGPRKQVWLERANAPVITPSFAAALSAERIQDDALFDAALVSFGSFGVILGVLIEAEPMFLLDAFSDRLPLDDDLKHTLQTMTFARPALPKPGRRPWHFGLIVNPHDENADAIFTAMYRRAFTPSYEHPVFTGGGTGPGDDALIFIDRVVDFLVGLGADGAVQDLIGTLLDDRYGEPLRETGTHAEIFRSTTLPKHSASSAIAVAASDSVRALELVKELNRRHGPFPGAVGMRFVGPTTATLGFTRFSPTCVLEIDGVEGDGMRAFCRRVWDGLVEAGIEHTLHWGKIHNLDGDAVRRSYGSDAVESWRSARRNLLSTKAREVFTSPLLAAMELG